MRSFTLCFALAACVTENRPAPVDASDSGDAASEVVVEACGVNGENECTAVDQSRTCQDGAWVGAPCAVDQSCSRTTGTCSKGTLSCLGTLVCYIDCANEDATCRDDCAAAASVPAVDALGALNSCQCEEDCWPILCGRLFPWPEYAAISSCVAAACAPEAARCAGSGSTGTGGCVAIRGCLLACEGDVFCAEACFAQGTAEAQTTAAFYYICVRQECGADPSSTCLFTAQANRCKALWETCQGDE